MFKECVTKAETIYRRGMLAVLAAAVLAGNLVWPVPAMWLAGTIQHGFEVLTQLVSRVVLSLEVVGTVTVVSLLVGTALLMQAVSMANLYAELKGVSRLNWGQGATWASVPFICGAAVLFMLAEVSSTSASPAWAPLPPMGAAFVAMLWSTVFEDATTAKFPVVASFTVWAGATLGLKALGYGYAGLAATALLVTACFGVVYTVQEVFRKAENFRPKCDPESSLA